MTIFMLFYHTLTSRWQRQHMLPLQFSAAPKLFPSFDDYCTIYCSSICSGILLLLLLQLASWLLALPPSSSDDQIIGNFESCCFNFTRTYPLSLSISTYAAPLRLLLRWQRRISHFNGFHFTHHSSSSGAVTQKRVLQLSAT